ncbi:hypothetical protein EVG20_g10374 [Dentipellis fragilis]|uniref:Uncharacterized protein n=1 Tax=Dentipellis fragilis TaxID=205917 RepID=A0A4Y9XRY7_9AGAM|nr:hypothetical protein EVG20_g10374 [Dentipellis fragilis]
MTRADAILARDQSSLWAFYTVDSAGLTFRLISAYPPALGGPSSSTLVLPRIPRREPIRIDKLIVSIFLDKISRVGRGASAFSRYSGLFLASVGMIIHIRSYALPCIHQPGCHLQLPKTYYAACNLPPPPDHLNLVL